VVRAVNARTVCLFAFLPFITMGCGTPLEGIAGLLQCWENPQAYGPLCLQPVRGEVGSFRAIPFHEQQARIGSMNAEGIFPAGELYVATRTTKPAGDKHKQTWLVINLDNPSAYGERSYSALTTVDCADITVAVERSEWSSLLNGAAPSRRIEDHSPPVPMLKPGGTLQTAIDLICKGDAGA
jgi:hypothetical protein